MLEVKHATPHPWTRFSKGFLHGSFLGGGLLAIGLIGWGLTMLAGLEKDSSTHGMSLLPLYVLSFGLGGGAVMLLRGRMTILTRWTFLTLIVAVLSGCSKTGPAVSPRSNGENTPISALATGYTNLYKVTPRPVFVNPDLAASCVGASKADVETESVRFGPHANASVLIYMNNLAADAFSKYANRYPVGAIIVKQKFGGSYRNWDGQWVPEADGVGGMVKRPAGYDPGHRDWEYFYFETASKIESGRISSCVKCHDGAQDDDNVFATWYTKIGAELRDR